MSRNRIIKNVGFLYLKMGVTILLSLYTTRIVLKALGDVDFGIYNVIAGAIILLGFINNSMSPVTQRFMSVCEGEANFEKKCKVFNASILLHCIIASIICLIFILFGSLLFDQILNIPTEKLPAAKIIYIGLIISTLFTIISVPYEAAINSHEDLGYYAIIGILETLLRLIIAIIIMNCNTDRLIIYGTLMPTVTIISLVIMRIHCIKKYPECKINIRKYKDTEILKDISRISSWNLLGVSSSMAGYYGGNIILNHYFGAAINSATAVASQINSQLLSLTNNMLKAVNPVIAIKVGEGNVESFTSLSLKTCKFSYYLLAILAIPCIIKAEDLLSFWLGDIPDWAMCFTRLLIIKSLIEQTTLPLGTSILAIGRISKYNIINFAINIAPIAFSIIIFTTDKRPDVLYWLQILFYGLASCLLRVGYISRISSIKYIDYLKTVLYPIIIVTTLSLIFCALITIIIDNAFVQLLLMVILTAAAILFAGLDVQERNNLIVLFGKSSRYWKNKLQK